MPPPPLKTTALESAPSRSIAVKLIFPALIVRGPVNGFAASRVSVPPPDLVNPPEPEIGLLRVRSLTAKSCASALPKARGTPMVEIVESVGAASSAPLVTVSVADPELMDASPAKTRAFTVVSLESAAELESRTLLAGAAVARLAAYSVAVLRRRTPPAAA